MDGMEITQFTYFQQAGGIELDPVSVEITYGLERLGDVPAGRAPGPRHGVVAGRHAGPTCCEAERAPVLGLQLRGGRHRDAAPGTSTTTRPRRAAASRRACRSPPTTTCSSARTPSTCSTPAARSPSPTGPAYILRMRRLTQAVAAALSRVGRRHARCLTCWSRSAARSCPAAHCREAEAAASRALRRRARAGRASAPSARHPRRPAAAGDHRARRSRAARGRAPRGARPARGRARAGPGRGSRESTGSDAGRARGARRLRVGGLRGRAGAGGRAACPDVVAAAGRAALQFRSTMRWPGGRFSRPDPLAGGEARRRRRRRRGGRRHGLAARAAARGPAASRVPIGSAATYLDDLRAHGVIVDAAERRAAIVAGLDAAGGWTDPMGKLDEVVYLVERPGVLEGEFAAGYLDLPERIPVTAMQSHQRYFPVRAGRWRARAAVPGRRERRRRRRRAARERGGARRPARRCRFAYSPRPGARPRRDGAPSSTGSASWRAADRWPRRPRGSRR